MGSLRVARDGRTELTDCFTVTPSPATALLAGGSCHGTICDSAQPLVGTVGAPPPTATERPLTDSLSHWSVMQMVPPSSEQLSVSYN